MLSYDTGFCHAANVLSRAVFGREVMPGLVLPSRYTGELIGIEYLFDQTGRALGTINDDPDVPDVDVVVGEDREMDEGFVEAEDGTIAAPEGDDANWLPARLCRTRSTPAVAPPVAVPRARRVRRVIESDSDSSPPCAVPSPPPCVSSRPRVPSPPPCVPSRPRVPSPPPCMPSRPRVPSPPPCVPSRPRVPSPPPCVSSRPRVPSPPPCVPSRPRVPSPPARVPSPPRDEAADEAVDRHSVPGYDRVQELAAHLVGVKDRLFLTAGDVDRLVELWGRLSAYDQWRVAYSPRYRERQLKGRFARTSSSVPGIESVKR